MADKKLQQGISILYDMELNNYLMTRGIQQLNYKISQLGRKKTFKKPVERAIESNIPAASSFCFGIGAIVGVIIASIEVACADYGLIWGFLNLIFNAIIYGLIFGIIGAVVGVIIGSRANKDDREKNKEQYIKDYRNYKQTIAKDNYRVQQELLQKKILMRQRDELLSRRDEAEELLDSFYSVVGIDPNYRKLIPIGYMDEFIRLGIAAKLEGADGLYYLIRQELRQDQIQCTLEEICEKIDVLIDNQNEIYYQLVNINSKCDRIVSSAAQAAVTAAKNNKLLETAVENTSITAYNSERISREMEFQSFMLAYNS